MQIDYALILSAGIGSRMGEIGKKIPKALWPIFFKNMLELQIDYCHDLGIKRIFVNTHFLSDQIEKYILSDPKFSEVTILHEDPLLDSGGAIHNMASRGDVHYSGNLLLVNADQFLFFDHRYFSEALSGLENSRAALFGITVDKNSKYNETVLMDERLIEIRKNPGTKDYITYSGLGILKLDGLEPKGGITKFFESVAYYHKERVQFVIPSHFEYWDFGTAENYFESVRGIYQNLQRKTPGIFIDFLKRHEALSGKIEFFYNEELNSINLEASGSFKKESIVSLEIVQKV